MNDLRDLPISGTSRAALDHYERAAELLAGFYVDPLAEVDAALSEDPGFVMGHCLRGALFLISTEKAAEPELRRSVEAAEALAPRANDRERGHIAALRSWLDGDFGRTAWLYDRVLVDHPRDLLALQIAHQCDFFLGRATELRDRVARVLHAWSEDTPGLGYVLGMHAFGLEETGDYGRAADQASRALRLCRRDPWAIHAWAHVHEMRGRADDGIEMLRSREADWAPGNALAYHNWWHLALFHLDLAQTDRTLAIYDAQLRPRTPAVALEMVDSAAMLWRLLLSGVDVGDRFAPLADAYEPMAEDAYYAFNDVHAMMAFVGAGRDAAAERVLSALQRRSAGTGTNAELSRDVGLPVARALVAFGRGKYDDAIDLLMPVRAIAHRFGGSHAQRDVLALTLVESALRRGDVRLARALAAERVQLRPSSQLAQRLAVRAR